MKVKLLLIYGTIFFSIGLLTGIIGYNLLSSKQIKNEEQLVQVLAENKVTTDKKIEEQHTKKGYKINAYYPYTPYFTLNQTIENLIQGYITDLKKSADFAPPSAAQYYTLDITYDTYEYKNFITYAFSITLYTGGAHPNTFLPTITFDKTTGEIVTINSLIRKNPNILNILSKESRNQLKNNPEFQDKNFINIQDMFLDGTKPDPKNFQNFAISPDGLIIFFENYQVAPYSYGSFRVTIPYSKLS